MSKKFIIVSSVVLAVLVATLLGVAFAFFGDSGRKEKALSAEDVYRQGRYGLISAVPADALAVASAGTFGDLLEYVSFSENCVSRYINRSTNQEFFRFCDDVFSGAGNHGLKGKKAIISFDYNGAVRPLLVLDYCRAGAADDALGDIQVLRDKYPALVFELHSVSPSARLGGRALLYVSTENYMVSSAIRNIEGGYDITSANGFVKAALACGRSEYFIVANSALGKFFKNNLDSRLNYALDFLKNSATWLTVCPKGENRFSLFYTFTKGRSEYFSMYDRLSEADCGLVDVVPDNADFVVSIPMARVEKNIEGYKNWFDYNGNIADYQKRNEAFRKDSGNGFSMNFVASSLGISGVSLVQTPQTKVVVVEVGKLDGKILCRDGAGNPVSGAVSPFPYKPLANVLCGDLFSLANRKGGRISVENDFYFTVIEKNLIISDKANLTRFLDDLEKNGRFFDTVSLSGKALYVAVRKTLQGDVLVVEGHRSKKNGQEVTITVSHPEDGDSRHSEGNVVTEESRPRHSKAVEESRVTPDPSGFATQDDGKVAATQDSRHSDATKGSEESRVTNKTDIVNVPAGPYKVKLANGKTVTFSPLANGRKLTFKDGSGKSQWTVSLPEKIAGKIEVVDFYKNGKQQFVFIAGNKLYVIDRLSHYLSGFPKTLKERVVLGPKVYDFNNNKKYNILVLTENNTIEMYNLKGEKPAGWQGIAGGDKQIVELPVRRIEGGKTQWIVKFSDGTSATYGFNGGKAL